VFRESDGEETGTAVGVDQVRRGREGGDGGDGRGGRREDGVSDVGGERDEDGVVVLEEGTGGEGEVEGADTFVHGGCEGKIETKKEEGELRAKDEKKRANEPL